jgi:hypothetical protein
MPDPNPVIARVTMADLIRERAAARDAAADANNRLRRAESRYVEALYRVGGVAHEGWAHRVRDGEVNVQYPAPRGAYPDAATVEVPRPWGEKDADHAR